MNVPSTLAIMPSAAREGTWFGRVRQRDLLGAPAQAPVAPAGARSTRPLPVSSTVLDISIMLGKVSIISYRGDIETMTRTSTQDLQEEFLTALRKGQQTMIGALRIWVETVQAVTPKLSGVYAPLTGKLPKLPNVSVPFAGKLPSPKEAVDSTYGLGEELLANQRKFAEADRTRGVSGAR